MALGVVLIVLGQPLIGVVVLVVMFWPALNVVRGRGLSRSGGGTIADRTARRRGR